MAQQFIHVVVTVDKENESLSVSVTESSRASLSDDHQWNHQIKKMPLSEFMSAGSEKAKSAIGSIIMTTFSRCAVVDVDDSDQGEKDIQSGIDYLLALMKAKADRNEVNAQEFLAAECLEKSLEQKDIALLDEAEAWYRKAAKNGSKSAKALMQNRWQDIYETYREQIVNGQ